MYLADYHTHTQFSPDAHDPMTVMAQAALDAGMDEICFTDHVEPLTWGSNELRPPYDWSALTEDFANVQAALGDRIHLRLGMEMGDAQKAPAHMKKLLEDAPRFDFVIGPQANAPHNCGIATWGDTMYVSCVRNIKEPELELHFYRVLQSLGLHVTVESNAR